MIFFRCPAKPDGRVPKNTILRRTDIRKFPKRDQNGEYVAGDFETDDDYDQIGVVKALCENENGDKMYRISVYYGTAPIPFGQDLVIENNYTTARVTHISSNMMEGTARIPNDIRYIARG